MKNSEPLMTNDLPNEASMPAWAALVTFEEWSHHDYLSFIQRGPAIGKWLRIYHTLELGIQHEGGAFTHLPCKTPAAALHLANVIAESTGGWKE